MTDSPPNRVPPRSTVLIDAGLRSFAGHHAEYARSFAAGAQSLGLAFRAFGPLDMDPTLRAQLHVTPVFRPHPPAPKRRIPGAQGARNLLAFRDDLRSLIPLLPAGPVVAYVDNTHHHDLLHWALSLGLFPAREITWLFMLRRCYYDDEQDRWPLGSGRLRAAFALLRLHGLRRRVRLVSDSERLLSHYRRLTNLPLSLVPIPHTQAADGNAPDRGHDDAPHFVFLGDARTEKGLLVLARAIREIRSLPEGRDIAFSLQAHQASGRDHNLEQALDQLRALRDERIRLLDQPLSAGDYHALLRSADAVLCPYNRKRYQGSSGPFTEALAMGKPVLTTTGTWMSDQLERHGAGVLRDGFDVAAMADGLLELRRRLPELKARAEATRHAWREIHSPSSFMSTLLTIASSTR